MSNKEILTEIADSLRETRPDLQVSIDQNGNLKIVGPFETNTVTVE